MVPETTQMSFVDPREMLTGEKLDAKVDLRVSFGEYVQTHTPNIVQKNRTSVPRTESAIALLPLGGTTGSVKFFCLGTHSVVTRTKWTSLPMQ